MKRNLNCIVTLVIGIVGVLSANLHAQSFLEELEKKVREGLKQPSTSKKNAQQGELPVPANRIPPNTPDSPGSTLELPGKSVLETPLVPVPTSSDASAAESVAARSYLGLEAEPIVGGGIGIRIAAVAEKSPAWKAGFKVGDVVRGIDGFAISDLDSMVSRLARRTPGEAVKFLISRGDRNLELTAVLQDTAIANRIQGPLNLGAQPGQETVLDPNAPAWLGLAVSDLSSAFRLQFGTSAYRGAAVTSVLSGSPADLAAIKPGDAIVEINGRAVNSSQDVLAFVAQSRPGLAADLLVFRGSTPRQVQIVLGVDPKAVSTRSSGFAPTNPTPRPSDAIAPIPSGPTPPSDLQKEVRALREELRKSRETLNAIERRMDKLLDAIAQPGN